MKKYLIGLFVLGFMVATPLAARAQYYQAVTPARGTVSSAITNLAITNPTAGQVINYGSNFNITWTGQIANATQYGIYLLGPSGMETDIAELGKVSPSSHSFFWQDVKGRTNKSPDSGPGFTIMVASITIDAYGGTGYHERAISGPFTIKKQITVAPEPVSVLPTRDVVANVTVLSPNGFDSFNVGGTMNIKWTYSGYPSTSTVSVSFYDIVTGSTVVVGSAIPINTGYASVIIPAKYPGSAVSLGGNNYKARVSVNNQAVGNSYNIDVSDNVFSIANTASTSVPAQKCGVKSLIFEQQCTLGSQTFKQSSITCYDGTTRVISSGSCQPISSLYDVEALSYCNNRCGLDTLMITPGPAAIPAKIPATVPVRSVAPATSAQISCPANFRLGTASSLVTESQKRLVSLGFLTMPRGAAYGFWGQASFDAWQRCLKSQEGSIATRVNVGDQVLVPIVQTKDATSITTSGATLNGVVNPNGATLSSWFELASNYNSLFGPSVNKYYVPGTQMANNTIVSATASKLAADTTYHYRLISQYTYGAVDGAIFSFKTKAPFGPAPAPTTLHR